MVQLPEPAGEDSEAFKAGYKTIADIGKERIRRVITKIKQEQKEAAKQQKLADEPETPADLGFRAFNLSTSNFKVWDGRVPADGNVEKQLADFIDNLHTGGTDDDILYELLLKSGFALTTPVSEKKIAGKIVYSIDNDALIICLEHNLTKDLIVKMAEIKPARAICLDAGFNGNDQLRTNALEIMKSHGVADFRTV
jgi:adenine-specific DNA-methyltransferase